MSSKYEFIDGEKANYPIIKMCRWVNASRSGFYEWRDRPMSATAERREALGREVIRVFDDSDGTYGYRRVHEQLRREGIEAGPELVRSLMADHGLVACQPKPYKATTDPDPEASGPADLCEGDFSSDEPGTKLVGDITYIRTWAGWIYLATVIDCYSKMVIGYAMADHMRTSLITQALDMAHRNVPIEPGCIFHSDRGSQYTSDDFAKYLAGHGMVGSMGRTGVCWDNAMAESFFGILKNEYVHRTVFSTRQKAYTGIARWIETWYNHRRLHSGIGYRTPFEAHIGYRTQSLAA